MNAFFIYIFLTFVVMFSCAKLSYKFKLLDLPNKRKVHSKATAYTGGTVISAALLSSIILFDFSDNSLNFIISMSFLTSIIGLIDDGLTLNVGGKLSLLTIPIFILFFTENLILYQLGDYGHFVLTLGSFQIPFTLICVLLLVNSFNYYDGLDGTLSFASISVFAILYFLIPDKNFQLFLILALIPVIIFLLFNFSLFRLPKMFLGNSGSLLLGFLVSFMLIYLASRNFAHPILLAWSVSIFVFEFLSINFIRLKNKKKLFEPGQDHLHHILFKKSKSIYFTNFFISLANIIFFILGYAAFLLVSSLASLILFISLFIIFLIIRNKFSIKI